MDHNKELSEGENGLAQTLANSQPDNRGQIKISDDVNVPMVGEMRPDPTMNTVESGKLFPPSLTGKDVEFKTPERPQAIEAPPKRSTNKPRRAQAISKRQIRSRRDFLKLAGGAAIATGAALMTEPGQNAASSFIKQITHDENSPRDPGGKLIPNK